MGVTTVERGGCKFGVYLDEELCLELKRLVEGGGYRVRSRIIQEALRLYMAESLWREVGGYVVGSLNVLYNHEVEGVDARLTDVQHEYADVVVSALHVHLDPRTCLLVIAVRGTSERVRELVKNLEKISGVLLVRPIVVLATPREAGVEVGRGRMT
ncbi:MAG: CopG family ribbon-helix-helix protein [Desulfurococcaceae archaeon]|jgi:CopG family nickel-responsive transcriptional regulator|nr:CopG family ribbon-helix-helix protein [Desulfurococcaceae archaeon]